MCGGGDNFIGLQNTQHTTIGINYFESKIFDMEHESHWSKHIKSNVLTAQVIHFATSFMPWSSRIPIGEGFHEFL